MKNQAEATGIAYYIALGEKNIQKVSHYLHPNIEFTDPQETVQGKEAVLNAAKGFSEIFNALTIRSHFGSENQAVIIYEVEIPGLTKKLEAASLLSFSEGLISKIQLFYDTKSIR